MIDPLAALRPEARARLRPAPHPEWMAPMLATLTDRHFSDPNWIYERKLDGERCLAFRNGPQVRLLSRNRKLLNGTYPEVADCLLQQPLDDFVADGELVAFEGSRTSFARLQGRMQVRDPEAARRIGIAVFYYVFDVLHVNGYDTTMLPLRQRKAVAQRALRFRSPVRYTTHRNASGEAYLEEACRRGWEGLIAKQADSVYEHGRSTAWLKFKCVNEQELVIGGFTDPAGSRIGLGALLVGYYQGDRLVYAGKVGTGFTTETLRMLRRQMEAREQERSPFATPVKEKSAHWVRPELVAQIGFTEWTGDGRLRHPRFLGLRRDKAATEVVRETPVVLPRGSEGARTS